MYREAVTAQSLGLPQPLGNVLGHGQPQRGCVVFKSNDSGKKLMLKDATRSGLKFSSHRYPGLKQLWALGRNRFAVQRRSSY